MIIVNNRDKIEWREGITVQDILDELGWEYSLITVTVNEKVVSSDDFDSHIIPDKSNVSIFHLAHGG